MVAMIPLHDLYSDNNQLLTEEILRGLALIRRRDEKEV